MNLPARTLKSGGRLDQLADKPAVDSKAEAIASTSVRGFSVATWAGGGLRFAAVSDVDARDLTRFAHIISAP